MEEGDSSARLRLSYLWHVEITDGRSPNAARRAGGVVVTDALVVRNLPSGLAGALRVGIRTELSQDFARRPVVVRVEVVVCAVTSSTHMRAVVAAVDLPSSVGGIEGDAVYCLPRAKASRVTGEWWPPESFAADAAGQCDDT
jgi:hypothetical protein